MSTYFGLASTQRVIDLAAARCTNSQLSSLLRAAKRDAPEDKSKEIYVSGNEEKLKINLTQAINAGLLDIKQVYRVICDVEEVSNQHVFYFKLKKGKANCYEGEDIARKLFTEEQISRFPLLVEDNPPVGERWADFRVDDGPFRWVAKLYCGSLRKSYEKSKSGSWKEEDKEVGEVHYYRYRIDREVFVMALRKSGILELRVPLDESRAAIGRSQGRLWQATSTGVNRADFDPLELTDACRILIENAIEESKRRKSSNNGKMVEETDGLGYSICNACLKSENSSTAEFSCPRGEKLTEDAEMKEAIRLLRELKRSAIEWKVPGSLKDEIDILYTIIGEFGPNHLKIGAKTNRRAVEHVFAELRRHS